MESLPTKEASSCTFLVVLLLRIHLPMQGTQVRSLVWEDSTCRGATKPNTLISQALDPLHTPGPQPCKHLLPLLGMRSSGLSSKPWVRPPPSSKHHLPHTW